MRSDPYFKPSVDKGGSDLSGVFKASHLRSLLALCSEGNLSEGTLAPPYGSLHTSGEGWGERAQEVQGSLLTFGCFAERRRGAVHRRFKAGFLKEGSLRESGEKQPSVDGTSPTHPVLKVARKVFSKEQKKG